MPSDPRSPVSRMAAREILPTPEAVVIVAARRFCAAAEGAVRARQRFVVALSGGSTPRALYRRLATPEYAERVDWAQTHVFWGDERAVPPDHPQSNFRMAREALLDHVPVPAAQIHRMRGEDDPVAAAAAYEGELRARFPDGEPRFDLALLGVGTNGHTASLFPGSPLLHERRRWVAAELVAEVSMWRLTLTPPVLSAAAEVLVLAVGGEKAEIVERVLTGPDVPDELPVQAIVPTDGRLTWLLDAAAAARL